MALFWPNWNLLEQEYCHPYGRLECPLSLADDHQRQRGGPSLLLKNALFHGNIKGVIKAVQDGACTLFVSRDPKCPFSTPLLIAYWLKHDDIAQFLLSCAQHNNPARPSLRREFAIACGEASISMTHIQCMVEYFVGSDIVQGNPGSFTPLHYACFQCHWPLIQYLLQHGADWNVAEANTGLTPLHVLGVHSQRVDDPHKCLASIISKRQDNVDELLLASERHGTTALECILQRVPGEARNFLAAWLVMQRQPSGCA